MNLLLRLVQTPYLLYMEDDWLALDHVSVTHVTDEALAVCYVMLIKDEPIVEVLLNDQSSRSCAYAAEDGCPMLGKSGLAPGATGDGTTASMTTGRWSQTRLHVLAGLLPQSSSVGRPPTTMRLLRKF